MAPFSKRYLKIWSTYYESGFDAEQDGKLVKIELAAGQALGSKELTLALSCFNAVTVALDSPYQIVWQLHTERGKIIDYGEVDANELMSRTIN